MPNLFAVDWAAAFVPDKPLLEIFIRGTVVYLSIFFLLRVVLKRQAGNVGLSDMLLIVLIADASQNAMTNEYRSVPNGVFLVATLIFWNYAIDWLSYRFPALSRLTESAPLQLIRDGQLLRENMGQELVTEDDLRCQLRKKGVADPGQVREAYIEGDGHFSVLLDTASAADSRTLARPASSPHEHEPDVQATLEKFLAAADRMKAAIAYHEERAAGHHQAAAALSHALSEHGVRVGPLRRRGHAEAPPQTSASVSSNGSKP